MCQAYMTQVLSCQIYYSHADFDLLVCHAAPPKVLHYGLIYTIANTNYTFDKHWHYDFDATACPPWDLTTDRPKKGLFPHPPRASSFATKVSPCCCNSSRSCCIQVFVIVTDQ